MLHSKKAALVLALLTVGCTPAGVEVARTPAGGDQGAAGAQGPPGPQGPAATLERTPTWVDRTGAQVSRAFVPQHVDVNGNIWSVSVETGQPSVADLSSLISFASADCQGPQLLTALAPRLVFALSGENLVRGDDEESALFAVESVLSSGTCVALSQEPRLMLLRSQFHSAGQTPSLPFSPPLLIPRM